MPEQAWVKSSYSGSKASCVEIAVRNRVPMRDNKPRAVRDNKERTSPVLSLTPVAWRGFTGRSGQLIAASWCVAPMTRARCGEPGR